MTTPTSPQPQYRFKVSLTCNNTKTIRRFTLTEASYANLVETLLADPSLNATTDTLNITYLDADNDAVSVCSQLELEEMLRELGSQDLLKLDVRIVRKDNGQSGVAQPQQQPQQPVQIATADTFHQAHGCDNCRISPIRGHRYHCKQCLDFDLCATCYNSNARLHNSTHQFEKCGYVKGEQIGGNAVSSQPKRPQVPLVESIICDSCAAALPRPADNQSYYQSTDQKHHLCMRCYPHRALLGISSGMVFEKQAPPPSYEDAVKNSSIISSPSAPAKGKFDDQIAILKSMDLLDDVALAEAILEKHNGNVPKTVAELVEKKGQTA